MTNKIKTLLFKTLYLLYPVMGLFDKFIYLIRLSKWIKLHPSPDALQRYIDNRQDITRYDLYSYLLKAEDLENEIIDYLEFGVYKGASLKWWSQNLKNPATRLFGFDTFTGLPEHYKNLRKGHFSTNRSLPQVEDDRVSCEIGLFQETLSTFMKKVDLNRKAIIHLDADLYSSTLYVLTTLIPELQKGSILIFDEFSGAYGTHEFRAFIDFISAYDIKYEFLGAVRNYVNSAFKLI